MHLSPEIKMTLLDAQLRADLAGGLAAAEPKSDGIALESGIEFAPRFDFRTLNCFNFHLTCFPVSLLTGVRQIEATSR
jgi:hypothetical protein